MKMIRIILQLLILGMPSLGFSTAAPEEFPRDISGLQRITEAYENNRRPDFFTSRELASGGAPSYLLRTLENKNAAPSEEESIALIEALGRLTRVALWQYAKRQVMRDPYETLPIPGTPESDLRILMMQVPYGHPIAIGVLKKWSTRTVGISEITAAAAGAELDHISEILSDIALERGPLADLTGWNMNGILQAVTWLELINRPSSRAALLRVLQEPPGRRINPERNRTARVSSGAAVVRLNMKRDLDSFAKLCEGLL